MITSGALSVLMGAKDGLTGWVGSRNENCDKLCGLQFQGLRLLILGILLKHNSGGLDLEEE